MTQEQFEEWYNTLSDAEKKELHAWANARTEAKMNEALDLALLGQHEEANAIIAQL